MFFILKTDWYDYYSAHFTDEKKEFRKVKQPR